MPLARLGSTSRMKLDPRKKVFFPECGLARAVMSDTRCILVDSLAADFEVRALCSKTA